MRAAYCIMALVLTGAPLAVMASDACEQATAPVKADFRKAKVADSVRPLDEGLVAPGFINLAAVETVHGIDVSKYQQKTDFARAKQCGAAFAYVRISGGARPDNEPTYRVHWRNARSADLLTGPYHNLAFEDAPKPASTLAAADLASLENRNIDYAYRQAQLFTSRLLEMLAKDPIELVGEQGVQAKHSTYLPIALDVSWQPQASGTARDRQVIGEIYGKAICAWLTHIERTPQFEGQPLILFTTPSILDSYALDKAPCQLSNLPLWLKHSTPDGAGVSDVKLCQGSGRCWFQQYTSYGGFAVFGGASGQGLDLNRYFGNASQLADLLQKVRR